MLSKISRGLAKSIQLNKAATYYAVRSFSAPNKDEDGLRKSTMEQDYGVAPKEQHLQFSKAPIMSNFGELPFGEIPEALKYVRPFQMTTLIKVNLVEGVC